MIPDVARDSGARCFLMSRFLWEADIKNVRVKGFIL